MLALTLGLAPAAHASTTADRAATYAYLQAEYALTKSDAENASASRAAVQAFAGTLGDECAGVLASVSAEGPLAGPLLGSSEQLKTPREEGESNRRAQQLQAIRLELDEALTDATFVPDLEASTAFEQAVAPLRWSNPHVAALVAYTTRERRGVFAERARALRGSPREGAGTADRGAEAQAHRRAGLDRSDQSADASRARATTRRAVWWTQEVDGHWEGQDAVWWALPIQRGTAGGTIRARRLLPTGNLH
jgi:hypothetical protein